jgi:c-di-GMP-related signal transduction protein
MSSVYVARQPIFEVGRGLYGYELALSARHLDRSR